MAPGQGHVTLNRHYSQLYCGWPLSRHLQCCCGKDHGFLCSYGLCDYGFPLSFFAAPAPAAPTAPTPVRATVLFPQFLPSELSLSSPITGSTVYGECVCVYKAPQNISEGYLRGSDGCDIIPMFLSWAKYAFERGAWVA